MDLRKFGGSWLGSNSKVPVEWVLISLHPDTSKAGRRRVLTQLNRLKAHIQIDFHAGFVVRVDSATINELRAMPQVQVAGGVYPRRKEVPRIRLLLSHLVR